MWRNFAKQALSRKFRPSSSSTSTESDAFVTSLKKFSSAAGQNGSDSGLRALGVCRIGRDRGLSDFEVFRGGFSGLRGYASAAEAAAEEEESSSGSEEIHELFEGRKTENATKSAPRRTVDGMGVAKYQMLRKRQVKMETEAWEEAARDYEELLSDMCEQNLAPNLPYVKSLFLGWFEPLKKSIIADLELCAKRKYKPSYAPYFNQLPADMAAVITMHTLMAMLMTNAGGVRVIQAANGIGEAFEHEVRLKKFLAASKKTKKEKNVAEACPEESLASKKQEMARQKVNQLMKKQKVREIRKIVKQHDEHKPWGQEVSVKVGSRLIQLFIESAYIQVPVDQLGEGPPDIRPAFLHSLKTICNETTSRRYGVIECDPIVRRGLEKTARHMVIPYMPMLVPPQNWIAYDKGAYLFLPSYVMRTHGARQQREVVRRTPRIQLKPVFEALDTLGSTKWRVNERVLFLVDRIWSGGGSLAGLVGRKDVLLPPKPDTEDESEIREWRWKVKSAIKENNEMHSRRCDVELKLAVARKMKCEEGFYYPHNIDFRGRAYPLHPYLNHLGSDLCRGILEFSEGRPLGKSGLRWLKIHLANVYAGGVDKLSYEGRVAFTENHMDDIFDAADRPLEGNRWWLEAEDPVQCLATCMNLTEALRSPNPETTLSYMPVHMDGSCNGLQHYAALGRDKLGAATVNLVAGEKPADVYSGIASRVLDIMREDARGDPITKPNSALARILINQVDRKLVKQTVMTSVYGVTYIGARDQIKKRLKERNVIADAEIFPAACYTAKITLMALGEMFEAARNIMEWLGTCAKIIATKNQAVQWTTPLGLPVVQPYRQLGRHLVKTSLQVLTLRKETDKVMARRQRTAFPPNFVHSLDGSHMMMTAVACKKAGLNFAGVHDCYWTHACDVDQMNRILREKFVELYEAPILEDLLQSFEESFPDLKFPPLPDRGNFVLKEVLDSPYFFN